MEKCVNYIPQYEIGYLNKCDNHLRKQQGLPNLWYTANTCGYRGCKFPNEGMSPWSGVDFTKMGILPNKCQQTCSVNYYNNPNIKQ